MTRTTKVGLMSRQTLRRRWASRSSLWRTLVAAATLLSACGSDVVGGPSFAGTDAAGQVDAGAVLDVGVNELDGAAGDASDHDGAGADSGATTASDAGDSVDVSGSTPDAAAPTAPTDVGAADGGSLDAGLIDTGPADTGSADSGSADTGSADTGALDGGKADTAPVDAGPADTGPADTGPADTGPADTGPADGGKQAYCGDVVCDATESAATCPFDCSTTGATIWPCVMGACAQQTTKCKSTIACVDAVGAALACADSCLTLDSACVSKCQQALAVNGDGVALLTCGVTKGCIIAGGPICGDGACGGGETPTTCPLDCKTICGDGKCELPETGVTCAQDCKPVFPACGDGACTSGESAQSCAFDCDPVTKPLYQCVKTKCPSQTATCLQDQACTSAVLAGVICAQSCNKSDIACLSGCAAKTAGNASATAVVSCGLGCFL